METASASIWDDARNRSSRIFRAIDTSFRRSSHSSFRSEREIDEEALKWAALEKLPTYNRLRTAILKNVTDTGDILLNQVDVTKLGYEDRRQLIEKLLQVTEEDNERFLLKLRDRMDKVGIEIPKIEVRFEHLSVDAGVYIGSRALPTLLNFSLNLVEAFLGFLHLWPSRKRTLQILYDISGIIKPSRMTLLLGPPSSGKTTLLLALAGKLDPDLKCSGRITYNGHELSEFVPQRTSAYISQHDLQMGEMTVRETLDFYGRCQGVGTRFEMLKELARREKTAGIKPDPDVDLFMKATSTENQDTSMVTDYVLKILNLDICADTLVGDEMFRGISGGQKKRVTTGEMLVGPARALFMDEISTGLDSSTTFQIVKCLRQAVHVMDGTMLVSLLQPAPETFELFDDIILLSEGQIVYQGPREMVLDFFETMGFRCPDRKAIADFLQEVTSRKDQEQYWADKREPYRYIPVKEFAEAFTSYNIGCQIADELAVPFDKSASHPAALTTKRYGLNKKELFNACLQREWLLMKRNSFIYIFKICQISVIALITMSVFWRSRMDHKTLAGGNVFLGALFFGLVNVMFNGFTELAMAIIRLPVLYKQRDLLLYPAWAFSLPTWVLRLPLSLIDTTIWISLTYYTIGFAPEASRFFGQFLLLLLSHQMALALFRLIASVGRSMVVGSTFGSFILLIFFLLGGFILSKDNIGNWWIWGYWISPVMYAQNGISINEYLAPRWNKPVNGSSDGRSLGKTLLHNQGLFTTDSWMWISIGALLGFIVLYNVLFTFALAYLNPLGKPQAVISKEVLEERHANRTGELSHSFTQEKRTRKPSSKSAASFKSPEIDLPVRQYSTNSSEVSSSRHDAVAGVAPKKGMVLPFQPLSLAFDDINYYVDMPSEMKQQGVEEDKLQLLQNVNGAFKPGVLTALVGVSGAGKTTLMDVLAGRKTGGYITGNISISGYPKKQETFARISGYCEQTDIHSPAITVYESMVYSAWLRLPKEVDPQTRKMFVEEVMELVELTPLRDAIVGLPGVDGLSTEQRKRLTIAVELVANPSIIFMDEPTSGLDARAAAIVMRTVRNTVDTGRTVVCTIHQPSIDIFEAFDELLLMKRGGQVIYAGTLGRQSRFLIEYFEAIPGVPKIKEGYNPATWMLDISSQASETRLGVDFAEIYKNSTLYAHNQALIKELSTPAPDTKELHFPTKYAQDLRTQFRACLWKQHRAYWRNPLYNAIRYYFTTIAALLFGTVFWNLGSKMSRQQDVFNIMGAMYASTLFLGVNNATTVQPVVGVERTVFYRERAAGMYSAVPYALSQLVIEVPYNLVQVSLFTLIVYPMISFQWTAAKFFWFFFFAFCSFVNFTYLGMMLVALTPNTQVASIIIAAFISLWNLFSGFLIAPPRIPIWWKWFYRSSPVSWTLYGLIVSQFGDLTDKYFVDRSPDESKPLSIAGFVKSHFGYRRDFLGLASAVEVVTLFVFAFLFVFGIKHLNFQRR